MKQNGFGSIFALSIVVAILIVSAAGYFIWQRSGESQATLSPLCVSQTSATIHLIEQFETAQMERNATDALALFTPPETPNDIDEYVFFSGSDTEGPRLYSSGGTNFNEPSYALVNPPQQETSSTCATAVDEQRSYYPEGVGGDFGPIQTTTVYFVTTIKNNNWKIESYLSSATDTQKYGGWLFLR